MRARTHRAGGSEGPTREDERRFLTGLCQCIWAGLDDSDRTQTFRVLYLLAITLPLAMSDNWPPQGHRTCSTSASGGWPVAAPGIPFGISTNRHEGRCRLPIAQALLFAQDMLTATSPSTAIFPQENIQSPYVVQEPLLVSPGANLNFSIPQAKTVDPPSAGRRA